MRSQSEKTITGWLPKGASRPIMEKLMGRGVLRTSVSTARGAFVYAPPEKDGTQKQSEFETLTVVVEASQADEIFEFIYFEGNVNQFGGGFLFMGHSSKATIFNLPKL